MDRKEYIIPLQQFLHCRGIFGKSKEKNPQKTNFFLHTCVLGHVRKCLNILQG